MPPRRFSLPFVHRGKLRGGASVDGRRGDYRREAQRHWRVLNEHLEGRSFIVGKPCTIADISAWGWLDRASRVRKGAEDPLVPFPNRKRLFETVNARPRVARVTSAKPIKSVNDEEAKRALFPSNFPPVA